jgi:hypothetical protein
MKTKFCDFEQIITIPYLECSQQSKDQLIDLIQCFYLPSEYILHKATIKDIEPIMTGHNEPSYISLYKEKWYTKMDVSNTDAQIVSSEKPVGCIVSYPAKLYYRPTLKETVYDEQSIYITDYLCIHREHDIKKISRKLLQTHEYNQRIQNPSITITLIKKEVELFDGVIPFVNYQTSTFYMRNIHFPDLPRHFQVVNINKTRNLELLTDFLYAQKNMDFIEEMNNPLKNRYKFDVLIIPDLGSLLSQINSKILYVFCLKSGEHIHGFYFIKDAKTEYEDIEGSTLHCVASVNNTNNADLFYLGFLHSLKWLIKHNATPANEYKMIIFEELGHNMELVSHWKLKHTPVFTNKSAYYTFNLIVPCSPMYSEKCLIIL